MNLRGRNAIVTGGAVRLGRALAVRLSAEGVNVCIHYCRSREAALSACDEAALAGVKAVAAMADFANPVPAAKQLMDFAVAELGPIDILINSAAIFEPATLLDTDELHWDRHFAINLKAPFFLSQAFVRQFGDRTRRVGVQPSGCPKAQAKAWTPTVSGAPGAEGAIVNIADWRGTVPVIGHLAYTQSKSALITQTKLLAQELGPAIRVNAIAPGAVLPPADGLADDFQARAKHNPLRRTGTAADVAEAMLLLLQNDFITGEVLHVSGGEQLAPER